MSGFFRTLTRKGSNMGMDFRIPGVAIVVRDGDDIFDVREDGFIGYFDSRKDENFFAPQSLTIEVLTSRDGFDDDRLIVFTVDNQKNIVESRDRDQYDFEATLCRFTRRVPVKLSSDCIYYTPDSQNNIRVLRLKLDGSFTIWEVAVISQEGDFFLTVQRSYEAQCYWNAETRSMICPRFQNNLNDWPSLVELLKQGVNNDLLPIFRDDETTEEMQALPDAGQGRVMWWSSYKGIGAIDTLKGVARVHWRGAALQGRRHLRYLVPGELVSYESLGEPFGNTRFKFEARGVKLVEAEESPALKAPTTAEIKFLSTGE